MRAVKWIVLLVGVMLALASCMDPEPGEISVRATLNGQRHSCVVKVFNKGGKQIDEKPTDNDGLLFLKQLVPGVYVLKFSDTNADSPTMYPAEKMVKVVSGGSEIVDVELTEQPAAPAGGESSGS